MQLCGDEQVERGDVQEIAVRVGGEEIACNGAAGVFVSGDPDELGPLVGAGHTVLRQQSADRVRAVDATFGDCGPDFDLSCVIVRDCERHELFKRHIVVGIRVVKFPGGVGQPQALLDNGGRNEKTGGDLGFRDAFVDQYFKGAELIERMQVFAMHVFGKAVFFGEAFGADNAGHGGILRHALVFDEQFEGAVTASAGGNFIEAGCCAIGVEDFTNANALQQRPMGDVVGEALDGNALFDATDVAVGQAQLVEGNIGRLAERNFGRCLWLCLQAGLFRQGFFFEGFRHVGTFFVIG